METIKASKWFSNSEENDKKLFATIAKICILSFKFWCVHGFVNNYFLRRLNEPKH